MQNACHAPCKTLAGRLALPASTTIPDPLPRADGIAARRLSSNIALSDDNLSLHLTVTGTDESAAIVREAEQNIRRLTATVRESQAAMRKAAESWTASIATITKAAKAAEGAVSGSITKMAASVTGDLGSIKTAASGFLDPMRRSAVAASAGVSAEIGKLKKTVRADIDGMRLGTAFTPLAQSMTAAVAKVAPGLDKINAGLKATVAEAKAAAAELGTVGGGGGSGRRSGGGRERAGLHPLVRMGERGLDSVSGFLPFAATPGTMAAAAGLGGLYESVQQRHGLAQIQASGLDPKELGMSQDKMMAWLRETSSAIGVDTGELEQGVAVSVRMLKNLAPKERFKVLQQLVRPSAFESYARGMQYSEALTSAIEFAHQNGAVSAEEITNNNRLFSVGALSSGASLGELNNTASYFLPDLQRTLGLDTATGLAMEIASKNSGLRNTKAGTSIRAWMDSLYSKKGDKKHNFWAKRLGLIDGRGMPTWLVKGADGKTDWLASINNAGSISERGLAGLHNDTERVNARKFVFKEVGERFGALMADPKFRSQIAGIRSDTVRRAEGEGDLFANYAATDPLVKVKQEWVAIKNVMADLGDQVLPAALVGLTGLDDGLKALSGVLKDGFNFGGKTLGEKVLRFLEPGLANRVYGPADRADDWKPPAAPNLRTLPLPDPDDKHRVHTGRNLGMVPPADPAKAAADAAKAAVDAKAAEAAAAANAVRVPKRAPDSPPSLGRYHPISDVQWGDGSGSGTDDAPRNGLARALLTWSAMLDDLNAIREAMVGPARAASGAASGAAKLLNASYSTGDGITGSGGGGKGFGGDAVGRAAGDYLHGALGPAFGKTGKAFAAKAPAIMGRLMSEYGLTEDQAAGIVGNLGHESAGFTAYHEGGKAPGKGGVGWATWTGSRRRQFEAFAREHHLDPTSDEASWQFLTRGDPEFKKALAAVRKTHNRRDATIAFEGSFERAGKKAWGSRFGFADRAAAAVHGAVAKVRGAISGAVESHGEAADQVRKMKPAPADAESITQSGVSSHRGGDTVHRNRFHIDGAQDPRAVAREIMALQDRHSRFAKADIA